MPKLTFHFLNVKNGDCSIIEHGSGHVSVIDVCNARKVTEEMTVNESSEIFFRGCVVVILIKKTIQLIQ